MNTNDTIDIIFKIAATATASMAIFQLAEAKKKRKVDMFWQVSEIYKSEEQRLARKNVGLVDTYIAEKKKIIANDKQIESLYNAEYHNASDEEHKKIDESIMNRLRFLNQIGVLLKRRLIDKDMLYGLIGVGLEIDYGTLKLVLDAHRNFHGMPYMYRQFETVWYNYNKWKMKLNR